ncbi:hypothetical protein EDC96DRAFT_191143 [Choanephora cucurbitarum]|nr:hypothetical protein EDC96DRAFT_191143 [Choanephora cucurbitarum]
MDLLPTALHNSRCILHVDLDCFYVQVEQVRLGIPPEVPAAVQQWHGLIAVNYAARKSGIKRMTNVTEAKKLCPNIRLLHVATYGPGDKEPKYHKNPDRNTHKVSLDAYREASREIFKIFHKHCDVIRKVGTDEGFMDVTKTVNQRLRERYIDRMPELLDKMDQEVCGVEVPWDQLGVTIESQEEEQRRLEGHEQVWSSTTWKDLQLALGAELAAEIRNEIYDTLKYTCSAGIAHNKTLAKLGSSQNKPNKQTVLRDIARLDFMRDIPFQKIRNLGGKLGSEIGSDLEAEKTSELWSYSVEELQNRFGPSTGLHIYNICRGIDHEEVIPSKPPQSLMASKSFRPPLTNIKEVEPWFSILAVELHNRITRVNEEFNMWPTNINIRYDNEGHRNYRSKTMGSIHKDDMKSHESLAKKASVLFNSLNDTYPCYGLDLCAYGLAPDESSKSHTLNRFFIKSDKTISAHHANGLEHAMLTNSTTTTSKQQKVKKNLFHFYMDKTSSHQDEALFVCDKCQQKVPTNHAAEHADYHFALELSLKEREQQRHPTQDKKRKSTVTDQEKQEKKPKKSLFFQPRSSS